MITGNKRHQWPFGWLQTIGLAILALMLITSAPAEDGSADPAAGQFGPITAEDTLWRIALNHRPDQTVTVYQYMLALVEGNPQAFIAGNANLMRSGLTLELPTADTARAVPADQAQRELQRQNEWFAALDREELRAIRLGQDPVEPGQPIARQVTPEPEPGRDMLIEDFAEVDSTIEPATPTSPDVIESESASPQPDSAVIINQPSLESLLPIEADSAEEIEAELVSAPDALAEPVAMPPPQTATPGNIPGSEQAGSQTETGLRASRVPVTIGLLVLAGLVVLWWWRRQPKTTTVIETEAAETIPDDSTASPDSAGDPVAVTAATQAAVTPPVPAVSEPPSATDPPEVGSAENDSWSKLEASILDEAEPVRLSEQEGPVDIGAPGHPDLDWDLDLDSSSDLDLGLDSDADPDPVPEQKTRPVAELDADFDFGHLDPDPIDDLELSSEVNLDSEPGASSDRLDPDSGLDLDLDLDLSFSESIADDSAQTSTDQPGFAIDPENEDEHVLEQEQASEPVQPPQVEEMSDADAELSLDLAGAMIENGNRDYALELLGEVIEKASETMASRARDIRDSLMP